MDSHHSKEEPMLKKIAFIFLILSVLLAGCAASATQSPIEAPSISTDLQRQTVSSEAGNAPSPNKSAYAADQTVASVDRLVIKNATLSIYVDDPTKSMDNICLLYTSPSPRDLSTSRMPSSA